MKKIIFAMGIMAMLHCANQPESCETIPKSDISSGQELCSVPGGAKHFRIEALRTAIPHSAFILFMGFDDNKKLPTRPTEKLKDDQFKAQFYHGGAARAGVPPRPPGNTKFYFGKEGVFVEHNKFNAAPVIVCFDVSSENSKPTVMTYWVHGEKGANCQTFTNLTSASAQATNSWSGGKTSIAKKKNYIYQTAGSGSPKKVVVFNETKGK